MMQAQLDQAAQIFESGWMPKKAAEALVENAQTTEDDMDLDDVIGHEPRSFSQIESEFHWDQKKEPHSEISSYGPDQNEVRL
jgi:hypothetical protein